ncbi:metalloregulator ArsR/SmtB family transcription factor [Cupriavidus sp. BIS7]|uniref:ArsR/SmtB family transcription factor n=1 Tax=Cupriavidus sp. BIS7 TaxID=1217718 RepID=UPI000A05560E|nr:metalloregulator ArsR/SmtB family transcription factor [Cupriavidus sp. BIS7]
METKNAVVALAALASNSRLEVYRLLVQAGPTGLSAGHIAEVTGLPASTLSFHLKELVQAGLVKSRQESRYVIYTANYSAMSELIGFLTENCCQGEPCAAVPTNGCTSCGDES